MVRYLQDGAGEPFGVKRQALLGCRPDVAGECTRIPRRDLEANSCSIPGVSSVSRARIGVEQVFVSGGWETLRHRPIGGRYSSEGMSVVSRWIVFGIAKEEEVVWSPRGPRPRFGAT